MCVLADAVIVAWNRSDGPRGPQSQKYSLEQAISDNAQLHTIAFSGLAFITGDFGAMSADGRSGTCRRKTERVS